MPSTRLVRVLASMSMRSEIIFLRVHVKKDCRQIRRVSAYQGEQNALCTKCEFNIVDVPLNRAYIVAT